MTLPKHKISTKKKLNHYQKTMLRSFANIARRRIEARGMLVGTRSPVTDAFRLVNDKEEDTYISGTLLEKYEHLMRELDPNGQRDT